MRDDRKNLIVELTLQFAIQIVKYCEVLEENKKFVISKQILRCGTSIGANVREAQNAESKNDFIHKMKIAAKEIDETEYWLEIIKSCESYPQFSTEMINNLKSINLIVSKIISTSKKQIIHEN